MAARAEPRPPAVARVLERVTASARRHRLFDEGSRVVAAVSGGPDSLCLLHALHRLRRLLRIEVVCFHFDHRLRPGSAQDAAYVRSRALRLGLPFVLRRATSSPAKGESVEAWARTERYRALFAAVEETGSASAAVGHTADDQAETVLLALLRGGGLEALSGMRPLSPPLVRPLLDVTREETEAFCRALRLRPRRDPMNEDRAYMRVGVRQDVIPLLEERLGRGVRAALVRTAGLLREDAAFLERLADEAAAAAMTTAEGEIGPERLLRADVLRDLPPPVAGRVVRRALLALGLVPETAHVAAVVGLAGGRIGARAPLPGGLSARRDREYVRVLRQSPAGPPPVSPRGRTSDPTEQEGVQ